MILHVFLIKGFLELFVTRAIPLERKRYGQHNAPYFRGYNCRLIDKVLLPDAQHPTMELLPPERETYLSKPFEFASEDELNKSLKLAASETLDTLYRKQKI